jgi:hypothetical protein
MSLRNFVFVFALAAGWSGGAHATGACPIRDAGPQAEWQSMQALEKKLVDAGWKVRRIKQDGQCYEVYGFDAEGKRAEAYFHPKSLEPAKAS